MQSPRKKAYLLIAVLLAGVVFSGAVCRRTAVRQGERIPVEQAQKQDLARAREALSEGRIDEAIQVYQGFLQEFPKSSYAPGVMVKIGEAYYRKGDCQSAKAAFRDMLDRFPREPEAVHAAWGIALCSYKRGDCIEVERAIEPYRTKAGGKRFDQMTLLLAECALKSGDDFRAFTLFSEELRRGSDEELRNVTRIKAELLAKRLDIGDLERAADRFEGRFPADLALLELTRDAVEKNELDRAYDLIKRFMQEHPRSPYKPRMKRFEENVHRWLKVSPNTIGVLLPQSGALADIGERALKGIMLGSGLFEERGPAAPVVVEVRDTGAEDADVAAMVEELAEEAHVVSIVGPLRTDLAEVAAKKAQEIGVPLIALSPGEGLPELGDMVYQNCLTKTDQVKALANYALNHEGMESFAVLHPRDAYGEQFAHLFTREITEQGGRVVKSEYYYRESTDFKHEIKELKHVKEEESDFEALFVPDSWVKVAMIAPQIRYYQLEGVRLLGVSSWHSQGLLLRTQPEDLEGAVFPDGIAPEAGLPSYNSFARDFKSEFKTEPGLMEAQAYEAVDLIVHLIRTYRIKDRKQMKRALDHMKDHPGALGTITLEPSGKWKRPVYLFMIQDSRFINIPGTG